MRLNRKAAPSASLLWKIDILEELVGEIWDEHDEVVEDFVPIDEHTYRILGSANQEKMILVTVNPSNASPEDED